MLRSKYKNTKTCGVIEVDQAGGITRVAEPVGVIAGVVPCTSECALRMACRMATLLPC